MKKVVTGLVAAFMCCACGSASDSEGSVLENAFSVEQSPTSGQSISQQNAADVYGNSIRTVLDIAVDQSLIGKRITVKALFGFVSGSEGTAVDKNPGFPPVLSVDFSALSVDTKRLILTKCRSICPVIMRGRLESFYPGSPIVGVLRVETLELLE